MRTTNIYLNYVQTYDNKHKSIAKYASLKLISSNFYLIYVFKSRLFFIARYFKLIFLLYFDAVYRNIQNIQSIKMYLIRVRNLSYLWSNIFNRSLFYILLLYRNI